MHPVLNSLNIKISGLHQCAMNIIASIMKIFRLSYCRASIAVFARADAHSKREIVREAGGLLVANASYPSNMGCLYGGRIRVIFLRITSIGQIKTTPTLPQDCQITALAKCFEQRRKSVLLGGDDAELRLKQLC